MTPTLLVTLMLQLGADPAAAAAPPADYATGIKPVLKARCWACHGALKQEAGLRLDTAELVRQGSDSGPVVTPERPAESPLINRISETDASLRMPPEGEPLSPAEIAHFLAWVTAGAPGIEAEQPEADPRDHWAFRQPVQAELPQADGRPLASHPIDAFVLSRLQQDQLSPRPLADKPTLLRRAYIDLIGLPPTREQLQAFLVDDSPTAWEAAVDGLLADPRYGERWARHWMDIWRYSDWYGRRHVPDNWNSAGQVWRWRDWIVNSLNDDKGYDRMVSEMLAADEICPEDREAGYATGYLIRNYYALNPNDWMRANVEHTGKAFLGLTFNCAHCHDHKYDPITQDEYFHFWAYFEPIGIRQERAPGQADPGPYVEYEYSKLRQAQRLGAVRIFDKFPDRPTWFYTGGDERNRVEDRGTIPPRVPAFLADGAVEIAPIDLPPRGWYPALRPEIQQTILDQAQQALAAAEAKLQEQRQIPGEPSSVAVQQLATADAATLPHREAEARVAAATAELASVQARIAADNARYGETPDADAAELARAASLAERQAAVASAQAEILSREMALTQAEAKPADDKARAKEIDAATQGLAAAKQQFAKASEALTSATNSDEYTPLGQTFPQQSTGRRAALAQWMTRSENPLTARVAINHIWLRHFHQPLVASVYDFGRNGSDPTHPLLLDWLSVELQNSQWSMKHIHRLILTSETWRRVSSIGDAVRNVEVDPDNHLLWRMNTGRMEAEVLRDSLLYCGGRLDLTMGGQELENTEALTTNRRSLYYSVFPEDNGNGPLMELFDAPNPLDCYRRSRSIVPQQALALTNSELVHQIANKIASDWQAAAQNASTGETPAADNDSQEQRFVVEMFQKILSRSPTDDELAICRNALAQQRELYLADHPEQTDRSVPFARESLVRALLNHNDFITIR